jgi:hypothetical protein
MKVAIMQPYVFPYLGYFQLISEVDTFIVLDDVNYINRGWINRNRILNRRSETIQWTIPLVQRSSNRLIKDHKIATDHPSWKKIPKTIHSVYANAPQFDEVWPSVKLLFDQADDNLSEFALSTIKFVLDYLNIEVKIVSSSSVYKNQAFKGQERIIDICKSERAHSYVNLQGGKALYEPSLFLEQGIELYFLEHIPTPYPQWQENEFVASLSILDMLMFNDKDNAKKLLATYELS